MKYILPLCMLFLVACQGEDKQIDKTAQVGSSIPAFNLQLADSTTWISTKDIPAGHATAIIYFGPYCPYSKHQVQEIVDNIEDVKDIHFYLVTPYPYGVMHQFQEHYKLSKYANIITGTDTTNTMGTHFNIAGFPYMAIYNRSGKLVKAYYGSIDAEKIKDAVKSNL